MKVKVGMRVRVWVSLVVFDNGYVFNKGSGSACGWNFRFFQAQHMTTGQT